MHGAGRPCTSLRRTFSGTTQVPRARATITGSGKKSADDSNVSSRRGVGTITLRATNSMPSEVLPQRVMVPSASMKSPARTGARNSTASYARNSPSSPSARMHNSVATSPKSSNIFAPSTRPPA